jgi:hypothetical protein
MHRLLALMIPALAAALVAGGTAAARGGTLDCGTRSIGPGALLRGGTSGAVCLLHAFQRGCTTADYRLSKFGVDTVNTEDFRVALRSGHCGVEVTTSFRVVPQRPHVTGKRQCAVLRRSGTGVVAVRCSGGPPATISLTDS